MSMKVAVIAFVLSLPILAEGQPSIRTGQQVRLQSGTPIKLQLIEPITVTNGPTPGSTVMWEVGQEVRADGAVVIAPGALASAVVKTTMLWGTRPRVSLEFTQVELVTGDRAALRANQNPRGMRVKDFEEKASRSGVVMPASTEVTVFVDGDWIVDLSRVKQRQVQVLPGVPNAANAHTPLILEDGIPVKLRIGRTVSSADAQEGERVDFEVLEEVRVGGLLVIPKSGIAWATVTEAQPKRRMGRAGKLAMNVDAVRLVSGERVALRAVKDVKGGGNTGKMTGAIVVTALVFWPAAPFFLLVHGKDITVPKGTEITAYVNGNFTLDPGRWGYSYASLPSPAPPASQDPVARTADTGTADGTDPAAQLEILSTPEAAEIYLNGQFVGSTPSTISVPAGEYTLSIRKAGYKAWERQMRVSTGRVRVVAELEQ